MAAPTARRKSIQRAVFDHIGAHGAPGLVAWHTPNGGKRNAVEAARFKAMGVRPGVSDLVAVHQGASSRWSLRLLAEGRPRLSLNSSPTWSASHSHASLKASIERLRCLKAGDCCGGQSNDLRVLRTPLPSAPRAAGDLIRTG